MTMHSSGENRGRPVVRPYVCRSVVNLDVALAKRPRRRVAALGHDLERIAQRTRGGQVVDVDSVSRSHSIDLRAAAEGNMCPSDEEEVDIEDLDLRFRPMVDDDAAAMELSVIELRVEAEGNSADGTLVNDLTSARDLSRSRGGYEEYLGRISTLAHLVVGTTFD